MQRTPDGLWRLWSSKDGILIRVHECVNKWNNHGKLLDAQCMHKERSGRAVAASLLRDDLPQATFVYERNNSVFSAGWILDTRTVHTHAAFPHDAWSGSNYRTRRECAPNISAAVYAMRRMRYSEPMFLKSPYNCFVSNTSRMIDMQKAFIRAGGEPSINQVQVTYTERDIIGVVYRGKQCRQYAIRASHLMGGMTPIISLQRRLLWNRSVE
jgi:hypothetical protein